MGRIRSLRLVERFENGIVVSVKESRSGVSTRAYIPRSVEWSEEMDKHGRENVEVKNVSKYHELGDIEEVVIFNSRDKNMRRAKMWARLCEIADRSLEYRGDINEKFRYDYEGEVRVPIEIASNGSKAAIAAYLDCHEVRERYVADRLGVSEQTIEQYVSDFAAGRR